MLPRTQNIIPPKKTNTSRFNSTISSILTKKQKCRMSTPSSVPSSSYSMVREFFSYNYELDDDFSILTWWKNHENQFPILAKIARDILVVPASTIAFESAFSAGRRVLDEKRSSLAPDVVKICVCKKDWDQTQKRQQGMKEDESDDEDDAWMTMDTSSESGTIHRRTTRIIVDVIFYFLFFIFKICLLCIIRFVPFFLEKSPLKLFVKYFLN